MPPNGRERLDDNEAVSNHRMPGSEKRGRSVGGTKWTEIALPTWLILAVSIPVMAVEEDWHGRPMIDEGTYLWIVPAVLVASAFLFGGALAGYRCPSIAVPRAVATASLALTILLICAVFRRLWVAHEGVPIPVVRLWCLGVVVVFILSSIGSLCGRQLAADR